LSAMQQDIARRQPSAPVATPLTGADAHEAALARPALTVVAVETVSGLEQRSRAWEDLARGALEPNVFYEPWQILPALEAFGRRRRVIHLFLYQDDLLCAYFPLERVRRFRGLPIPVLTLWKHIHCFLCTPLIRPGFEERSLAALLAWARSDPRGAAIVQMPKVTGDGAFHGALVDFLARGRRPSFVFGTYDRALFIPRQSADRYLEESMSGKSRKQVRRLTRRFSEVGTVTFTELAPGGDLDVWVRDFLALEASGWKGRAKSALACHEAERSFFMQMTREAHRRGRLMMLAMHLDGRPVAMKCNLLAGEGSFSFKIAFDEAFARFSPGVLLEVENIRRLHFGGSQRWMDSCAVSNHSMANRLWIDRRTIQTYAIATGRALGDFFVGAMPLVRWLTHRLVRPRPEERIAAGIGEQP